jgi:hypothetical protein
MKILIVGAETDRHEEASSGYLQFCEIA